ncbi:hypothetical protein ACRAWD_20005 [Caulobacter segnis]
MIGRERLLEMSRARFSDASDRSIDVLVSRLRRKLGRQRPGRVAAAHRARRRLHLHRDGGASMRLLRPSGRGVWSARSPWS